jgi:hypothetical protein
MNCSAKGVAVAPFCLEENIQAADTSIQSIQMYERSIAKVTPVSYCWRCPAPYIAPESMQNGKPGLMTSSSCLQIAYKLRETGQTM